MERGTHYYQLESMKNKELFVSRMYRRIGELMMKAASQHRQKAERAKQVLKNS